jgi:immune inhibitor A
MRQWNLSAVLFGICALGFSNADAVMSKDGKGPAVGTLAKTDRDQPNPIETRRIRERQRLIRELRRLDSQPGPLGLEDGARKAELESRIGKLAQTGTDRVLVILVEFNGTNTFTWTPGISTWDPYGLCEQTEFDGTNVGNTNASAFFAAKYGIVAPTNCRYAGPLHNQIPRPLSAADDSGDSIWTADFSPAYYSNVVFGNGWTFSFNRQDGSPAGADFTGQSVRNYYRDCSSNRYDIVGDVVGWVKVTNSVWYYGADPLPGRKSGASNAGHNGAIPGAGDARRLVIDALEAVKAAYPAFNWAQYDGNGDTLIDRLWIIHAGYGEEDSSILLNRTAYGEGGLWSHASSLSSNYPVAPGLYASAYIMMPENCGIGVLAHEYAHNLGAGDLYAYGDGETSAGFWTLMADDWTGFPLGFQPQAMDPLHLDDWGWLDPLVVTNPTEVREVWLGQASQFPGGSNVYRAVKIELPDHAVAHPVVPRGTRCWWGGTGFNINASMVQAAPLPIPAGGANLIYEAAYETEADYDFFRVLATTNAGGNWAVLGAFSGTSPGFPAWRTLTNSLAAYAGKSIQLAFQYYTDYSDSRAGAFVDEIRIVSGATTQFQENAETDSGAWYFYAPWDRSDGSAYYAQNYYLQWRNTATNGGYDSSLGGTNWRFGPVNSGLIVWHHNSYYSDNEIAAHLTHPPAFGPKGRMLVVDAHPEPYRDPYWLAQGYACERANVFGRALMRDASFSLSNTPAFSMDPPYVKMATNFAGRPAVPLFSDALGYYPGLEKAILPGGDTNRWMTAQWDAGVVIPCAGNYGVKAPGYPAGSNFWYVLQEKATSGTNLYMKYTTNLVAGGTTPAGGSGNPGATGAAYGWNVRILSQTPTQALVRIWNGAPFEITSISRASTSSVSLRFDSIPGRTLAIAASSNLAAAGGGFSTIVSNYSDNHATVPASSLHRFYRLGIP